MDKDKVTKIDGEYGRIFAEIRKSKGYSQHELEDSTVSAASISRFERGETMIGTDSFLKILRNVGVTATEFETIFQRFSNHPDPLPLQSIWSLVKAAELQNFSKLESLLDEIKQEIKKEPNLKKYQFDRIIVETALSRQDSSRKISTKDKKFLADYLLKTNGWGRNETILLSWTAVLFDTETLERLYKHMYAHSEYNALSFIDKKFIVDTALNILDTFLAKKELTAAKNIILQLGDYEINPQLLFEKMELKYNKARFNFLSDINHEQALEEMWYYYDVLKYAESFELANIVRKEIKDLTNEDEKKKEEKN